MKRSLGFRNPKIVDVTPRFIGKVQVLPSGVFELPIISRHNGKHLFVTYSDAGHPTYTEVEATLDTNLMFDIDLPEGDCVFTVYGPEHVPYGKFTMFVVK